MIIVVGGLYYHNRCCDLSLSRLILHLVIDSGNAITSPILILAGKHSMTRKQAVAVERLACCCNMQSTAFNRQTGCEKETRWFHFTSAHRCLPNPPGGDASSTLDESQELTRTIDEVIKSLSDNNKECPNDKSEGGKKSRADRRAQKGQGANARSRPQTPQNTSKK